jgi:chitin synthase
MRFVVFIDLLATIIQPATVVYLAYLAYSGITQGGVLIFVSLMMLAAIYGLQAIIFLLKRKWEHIGYMIISVIALPLFSFFIPVYSFWHFDDFSWGNTRLVVGGGGDQGKKYVAASESEKFNPRSIPRKKWVDYEQELWESGSQDSRETHQSRHSRAPTVHSYRSAAPSIHSRRSQGGGNRSVYAATIHGSGGGSSSIYQGQTDHNSYAPSMGRPFNGYSTVSMQHHPSVYQDAPTRVYGGDTEFNYTASPHPPMNMMMSGASVSGNVMPMMSSTPSRPASIYNGGGGSHYVSSVIGGNMSGIHVAMPTDEEILTEVRNILAIADLMTVTKKQVRDALSNVFGMDMQPRKEYINQCIEHILQSRL